MPSGANVAPNQSITLTPTLAAPSTAGTYNFEWQMATCRHRIVRGHQHQSEHHRPRATDPTQRTYRHSRHGDRAGQSHLECGHQRHLVQHLSRRGEDRLEQQHFLRGYHNERCDPIRVTVTSVNASYESAPSASVTGYANVAPSSASASISTAANVASAPVTPTVVDPNVTAGETEVFTFSIASQPAHGTASISGNQLVYTPPAAANFSGTTSFTFTVVDKGGASINGTATVSVTAVVPSAPTSLTATQGTVTNAVNLSWTEADPDAAMVSIYSGPSATGPWSLLQANWVGTSFSISTTSAPLVYYALTATSMSGGVSGYSSAVSGYPNIAPTSTTVILTAVANGPSTPVTPTVVDPNVERRRERSIHLRHRLPTRERTGDGQRLGQSIGLDPAGRFQLCRTHQFRLQGHRQGRGHGQWDRDGECLRGGAERANQHQRHQGHPHQ